jgi:hypothetical protein
MGATTNEIPRLREAGDHPAGRAVAPAGEAHAGHSWASRAPPSIAGMTCIAGGVEAALEDRASARSGLEPHPDEVRDQIIDLALDRAGCHRGSWR